MVSSVIVVSASVMGLAKDVSALCCIETQCGQWGGCFDVPFLFPP